MAETNDSFNVFDDSDEEFDYLPLPDVDAIDGGLVWCSVVGCGGVWCGGVWWGVVWCGVMWCGVVWCGVVWCGVVWCVVFFLMWCWVVVVLYGVEMSEWSFEGY